MSVNTWSALAALFVLAACGTGATEGGKAPATAKSSDIEVTNRAAPMADGQGGIDIAVIGKTVGAHQDQCELSFTVANNSRAELKNLYVELAVFNADSGLVVREDQALVVAEKIPPGQSGKPFGPIYVDGLACAAVRLQALDQVKRHCRKDCVPYRYTASGIAGLK